MSRIEEATITWAWLIKVALLFVLGVSLLTAAGAFRWWCYPSTAFRLYL